LTPKPPPKPPPSARKPAARGTVAAAASPAHRKSAPVPVRRVAASVAKAPEPHSHKKGAPASKLTAAQERSAASHKSHSHAGAATDPRRGNGLPEDRQSQLKLLIARGKEQGYLTYAQVNDHLPAEIVDPEQIEGIVNTINDMGIPVYERAPDTESLLANEPSSPADDEAIEEAAAALAALDAELGRTTDPVRMYMREMGTVELLTREGEIRIAKRIEEGLDAGRRALAMSPATYDFLLRAYEPVKAGQGRLVDLIVGFIDPNAPDVIAQPQNPTKVEVVVAEEKADDEEEAEGEAGDAEEEVIDTGPDPIEAASRFTSIAKIHTHVLGS